jgi:hypothetical protein
MLESKVFWHIIIINKVYNSKRVLYCNYIVCQFFLSFLLYDYMCELLEAKQKTNKSIQENNTLWASFFFYLIIWCTSYINNITGLPQENNWNFCIFRVKMCSIIITIRLQYNQENITYWSISKNNVQKNIIRASWIPFDIKSIIII